MTRKDYEAFAHAFKVERKYSNPYQEGTPERKAWDEGFINAVKHTSRVFKSDNYRFQEGKFFAAAGIE